MTSSEQKDLTEMVVYILDKTKGLDLYHIFKVLYFAEMEHLAKWGVRMIEEDFEAWQYGPVLSGLYKAIKHLDNPSSEFDILLSKAIKFAGTDADYFLAIRSADMLRISRACKEALDKSISDNASLSFADLIEKSHGAAWQTAFNSANKVMCPIAIAKEKGIDDCTLAYLKENLAITAALS